MPNPNFIFFLHLGALYISCGELWSEYVVALERSRSLHIDTGKHLQEYSGAILMFWGTLFILRAAAGLALSEFGVRDASEAAIHVADILIGPSWIWAGWNLFRGKDRAVLGLSVLFQATTLFFALVLVLLLRPFLLENTVREFDDIMVVAAMGLTVAIPFIWMYSRAHEYETKARRARVIDYRHST